MPDLYWGRCYKGENVDSKSFTNCYLIVTEEDYLLNQGVMMMGMSDTFRFLHVYLCCYLAQG